MWQTVTGTVVPHAHERNVVCVYISAQYCVYSTHVCSMCPLIKYFSDDSSISQIFCTCVILCLCVQLFERRAALQSSPGCCRWPMLQ